MKILVIDDNQNNLDAAKAQLSDEHKVVTAQTFDEAAKLLCQRDPGHTGSLHFKEGKPEFDVVMADLYMPASLEGIGNFFIREEYKDTEQPYGLTFALTALRRGTKYIALNSDGGHHDGPILHAIDMIGFHDNDRMMMGDSVFVCGCFLATKGTDGKYIKDWKAVLNKLLIKE